MPENILKIRKIDDTEESPDYVGIKVVNGEVEITIPKFLDLSEKEEHKKEDRELLLAFLRSINIAKTLNRDYFKKQKADGNTWPIESYLWIINDYIENGIYFNRDKKYFFDNKGRIEWKKTIKNMPIISNGNVIYDKLVTSRTSALNSEITEIYKICLKYSIEKMSWYRDLNINIEVKQTKSPSEMLYIIRKELTNTFDDIKRLRFNHMINILSLADEQDMSSNNFTYWINNYHYVYERMVNYLFKGISEKEKTLFNPKGSWTILGQQEDVPASSLRPDTIFINTSTNPKEVFIIDAKMYKFGYTTNLADLPETTSIQKQITYGDHVLTNKEIKDKYGKVTVRNAFIIPYNKTIFSNTQLDYSLEKINDNLYYVGEAHAEWRNTREKPHERIFTFLIDFNYLLQNYLKADSSDIDILCKKIDEYLENANNQGGQNNE